MAEQSCSPPVNLTTKHLMCYSFGQPECNFPEGDQGTCMPIDQFTDILIFGLSALFQAVIKATLSPEAIVPPLPHDNNPNLQ